MSYIFEIDNTINVISTFVMDEYRGKGLGMKLFNYMIDYVKGNNYKVIPTCSYVKDIFNHKKDLDIYLA